jgi:glyoxylase-like metal-dependent hydrolase (beta-lactamase superfamily II)
MINIKTLTLTQEIGTQTIDVHPVIIFNDSDLVLCDAGYPNQVDQINSELNKYGFSISDITKIVITHHDHDHVGSLSVLKKMNKNLMAISSEIESSFIEDQSKSLRLFQAKEYNKKLSGKELEFGVQFVKYLESIQNCDIDQTVQDGDYILPGLRVVFTPGHTPGHISLLGEDSHVIITGDALAIENSKLIIANPEFTLDIESCVKSITKILHLAPKELICYHGGTIRNGIDKLLRDILDS